MPACRYVDEISSADMLATKRSVGVTPEVNLRECVTPMPPPSVNKVAHSGFETQRRRHQKSKTGCQWPHNNNLCSLKLKKNYFRRKSSVFRPMTMAATSPARVPWILILCLWAMTLVTLLLRVNVTISGHIAVQGPFGSELMINPEADQIPDQHWHQHSWFRASSEIFS